MTAPARLLPRVSPKVLSERLDGLERRGLVARQATATFPRGVAYALSPEGAELTGLLDGLELWSHRHGDGTKA